MLSVPATVIDTGNVLTYRFASSDIIEKKTIEIYVCLIFQPRFIPIAAQNTPVPS